MVCETADELQARLALRALWPRGDVGDQEGDGAAGHASLWHKQMRAEVEDVLQQGLKRRLARIEKKVAILCQASVGSASSVCIGVQTDAAADAICTKKVARAFERALQTADDAAKKPTKVFGPTGLQGTLRDPKEEKEDGFVCEVASMKCTLESLGRSLGSRERQIAALQKQLETCKNLHEERVIEVDAASEDLRRLLADPSTAVKAHSDRLRLTRTRVAELSDSLRKAQEEAKRYRALAQQQHSFYLQGERIVTSGSLARHPAGDIFLVQRPLPMGDEKAKVWDVGTAIANPYIVDSWPFEPNVLAQRSSKEASLKACIEETEEDLEKERRRLPNLRLRSPAVGYFDDDDDDSNDRYQGPSETARSA